MKVTRAAQIVAVIFCLLLGAPQSRDQEFNRRDGNWWTVVNRVHKGFYIAGFVDGMEFGNRLSLAGIDKNAKDYKEVSERITTSYANQRAKYVANVTHIQLSDGLDAFYADSANRRILVHDAMWLVVNRIAGTPEAELKEMIESYRKSAEME